MGRCTQEFGIAVGDGDGDIAPGPSPWRDFAGTGHWPIVANLLAPM